MKRIALTVALALAAAGAFAQHGHYGAASQHIAQAPAKDLADGEVRKIDKAVGKLTIKHGEIKSIGMAPMTMVFKVKDPALLDNVAVNDKIRFSVIQSGSDYVVTAIEKAR